MSVNEASQLQMLICDQASSYMGNSYVMFKMFSIFSLETGFSFWTEKYP